jgi:hypothetical protein
MSAVQQALRGVGLKGHNLVLFTPQQRLENNLDGVFEPMTKQRRVQVQRAGGYFKARYQGRSTCCFGYSRKDATKNLKFFDGE